MKTRAAATASELLCRVVRRVCCLSVLAVFAGIAGCRRHAGTPATNVTGTPAQATDLQHAAAAVTAAQQALLLQQAADMETDVAIPARGAIAHLKDTLVHITDATLATLPGTATVAQAQSTLTASLPLPPKSPVAPKPSPDDDFKPVPGLFGGDLAASVQQPTPGLLLIEESFSIPCGTDTVLLAYSNASGTWKRILRWQAKPYDTDAGAFGDLFETRLLQPKRNGHPVLLVVHGTPWCTSTVSSFAMDTFELNPGHETETPFWHADHGYRRADDVPPLAFSQKTTNDGFEVRASVNDWTDAIARLGVMRYRLTPDSVERTLPIAMNARESVEEWLSMPRAEAAGFADAPAGSLTWRMYDTFTYDGKPEDANVPSMLYGPVHACTDARTHYQVEIDSKIYSHDNKTSSAGQPYFVQLQETGNGYRIHHTTARTDPACAGAPLKMTGSGY